MTEQDLAGRRALVTGGASGIGLACATEFASRGATVSAPAGRGTFTEAQEASRTAPSAARSVFAVFMGRIISPPPSKRRNL